MPQHLFCCIFKFNEERDAEVNIFMAGDENDPAGSTARGREIPQTSEVDAQLLQQSQNMTIQEESLLQEPVQKIPKLDNGCAFSSHQHEQAPDVPKQLEQENTLHQNEFCCSLLASNIFLTIVNSLQESKKLLGVENCGTSSEQEEKPEPQSQCELPVNSAIPVLASEGETVTAANYQTKQKDRLPPQPEILQLQKESKPSPLASENEVLRIANSPQESETLLVAESCGTSSDQEEKAEPQRLCKLPVISTLSVLASEDEAVTAENYQTEQNDRLSPQPDNLQLQRESIPSPLASENEVLKITNSPQESEKLLVAESCGTSSDQEEKAEPRLCELPVISTLSVLASEDEAVTAANYQTEQNEHIPPQPDNLLLQRECVPSPLASENEVLKIANSPQESETLLVAESCGTSSDQEEKPVKTEPQSQCELPVPSTISVLASESETLTATYQIEQSDCMPQESETLPAEVNPNVSASKQVEVKSCIIKDFLQGTEYESWSDDTSTNCAYRLITLDLHSPEFKEVKRKFARRNKMCFTITDIQKVINPYLLMQYKLTENLYKKRYELVTERTLFHGTKDSNIDSICKYNFDWRLNGQSRGHKFGQGVSFSPSSYYATHYSGTDIDKVMIAANVLVSRHYVGSYQTIVPKENYDTTTNETEQVLVKYEDNTFYPSYLIHYG